MKFCRELYKLFNVGDQQERVWIFQTPSTTPWTYWKVIQDGNDAIEEENSFRNVGRGRLEDQLVCVVELKDKNSKGTCAIHGFCTDL